jgi:hypothetical protein
MSKRLIIVAAVMLASIPAFAAVQNVKVSGDIETFAVLHDEYDLSDTGESFANDAFFATITRLRIDADLTDNVSATVRLLNERIWDTESASDTDVDLDNAFVTLKEVFYSPLTLIIGRQDLRYGNALVVGDPDTNAAVATGALATTGSTDGAPYLSKRKAFDAIRVILDYDPWTIEGILAKIDENTSGTAGAGVDSMARDVTLYGVDVSYDLAEYNATLEGYWFVKDSEATTFTQTHVIGVLGSVSPVDGLTLSGEVAYQFGDYDDNSDLDAWAVDLAGNYTWALEYEPSAHLAYFFRSGQSPNASATADYEAWDPMYEDQTHGIIADYIFTGANNGINSNTHTINLGGSLQPLEDLTVGIDWYHYILDESLTSSGTTTLSGLTSYTVDTDDDFGDEIHITLTYDYSEDVQFGLTVGWFLPGDTFTSTNDDDAFAAIGSVGVTF